MTDRSIRLKQHDSCLDYWNQDMVDASKMEDGDEQIVLLLANIARTLAVMADRMSSKTSGTETKIYR